VSRKHLERYDTCPSDGLRREVIGAWSTEKHLYLRRYVDIIREAARKFPRAGTTYIDLFSGPGRALVSETGEVVDGSPLVATKEALRNQPFRQVFIGDLDPAHIPGVQALRGPAVETAKLVVERVHRHSLNLALLDPFSLGLLSFDLIRTLATVQRMDLLIHFSLMDFNRNVRQMIKRGNLDVVFPGWRDKVDVNERDDVLRQQLFQHWKSLLKELDYIVEDNHQMVTGQKNQPFYLLVLASRHPIAGRMWSEAIKAHPQADMFG
jgi:three-Cys-motif partner protein